MPLSIHLLRSQPDLVKQSEKRRFKDPAIVDRVLEIDERWRKQIFRQDKLRESAGRIQRDIGVIAKAKGKGKKQSGSSSSAGNVATSSGISGGQERAMATAAAAAVGAPSADVPHVNPQIEFDRLIQERQSVMKEIEACVKTESDLLSLRNEVLGQIGNLVDPRAPFSETEEKGNRVLRQWNRNPAGSTSSTSSSAVHAAAAAASASIKPPTPLLNPATTFRPHWEILKLLKAYDPERGSKVAGHRGYFLQGCGLLLNMALVNYGVAFLAKRGYLPIQPPFFMQKELMGKTAELHDFNEQLYAVSTVSGKESHSAAGKENANLNASSANSSTNTTTDLGDASSSTGNPNTSTKYLIATSEQPLSAMHSKEWFQPQDLPIKYAGTSTCFRKEAGGHGRDTLGLFRLHQFEKVEQFVLATPDESDKLQTEMMECAEDFYRNLGLPYRVVEIVRNQASGALNDAASRKFDIEAFFPGLQEYKELVSCSNCTDYQSRALEIRLREAAKEKEPKARKVDAASGGKEAWAENDGKSAQQNTNNETSLSDTTDTYASLTALYQETAPKDHVHLLNSTLCATERTICAIVENYQRENGVEVPAVLQPYLGGAEFFEFKPEVLKEIEKEKQKEKQGKAGKAKQGGASGKQTA